MKTHGYKWWSFSNHFTSWDWTLFRSGAEDAGPRLWAAEWCWGLATLFMWQGMVLTQDQLLISCQEMGFFIKGFFSVKTDFWHLKFYFLPCCQQYNYDEPACSFLCVYPFWNSSNSLNLWIYVFHQFWKILCHCVSEYSHFPLFESSLYVTLLL